MAIFTITECDEVLAACKQAIIKVLAGQSHELETAGFRRKVTRADLPDIEGTIKTFKAYRDEADTGSTGSNRINVARVRRW